MLRTDLQKKGYTDDALAATYRSLFGIEVRLSDQLLDQAPTQLLRRRVWEETRPHLHGEVFGAGTDPVSDRAPHAQGRAS